MDITTLKGLASTHHTAFLGKTGSGKSNGAKVIVEAMLDARERVCILDPTGAWYGLRLKADGSPSEYPVVIFGGLHADVQIGRNHGAAVAEVVATSSTPAVIDTRTMTVGERTEFFTDFAETLLRKNRGPLTLVMDEAHVFAPQGRVADPKSGRMLHAANNLVSLGRSAGLRIMLLTQRPAKLHKDSLTQVETLIALRLIAPQDRNAVEDWIGEWAGKGEGRDIINSLPSLSTGDAWIWSPEAAILERWHFPLASTYDSGRAPSGEDTPELQPIDLGAVNAMLEQAAADIIENDPKALKARIAELERGAPTAPSWPDQREEVERLKAELAQAEQRLREVRHALEGPIYVPQTAPPPPPEEPFPRHIRGRTVEEAYLLLEKVRPKEGDGQLNAAALDLAALLKSAGKPMAWDSLLVMGGYRPGSGWIRKSKNELIENGLIEVEGAFVKPSDKLMLCDTSFPARRLPTPAEMRELWKSKLRGPGAAMADWLAKYGPASRKEVAEGCGFSPTAGWTRRGFKDMLGSNLAFDQGDNLVPNKLLVD